MTRDEYLSQLKYLLGSLSEEERMEALQYYMDYFDEAGDDAKVMSELGSPEELARSVNEKFATAVMHSRKEQADSDATDAGQSKSASDSLYFNFAENAVKSLELKLGAAEVVFISGKEYCIESRGIDSQNLECFLGNDGVLIVRNMKKINLDFFSHERSRRVVPRILVTVPENARMERFKLSVGAGRLRMKGVSFSSSSSELEIGAGSVECGKICSDRAVFRCGMGNLEFAGSVKGNTVIDCGMGCVKLRLEGSPDSYSYNLRLGLGEFNFNSEKKSGICQVQAEEKKENHFAVSCGMGNVSIYIG
ncbi:MAG: DUF1700 domain-containing protein [Treponema sp.]|nr:DUF1700 domain-containing protein [Treponema sp.]